MLQGKSGGIAAWINALISDFPDNVLFIISSSMVRLPIAATRFGEKLICYVVEDVSELSVSNKLTPHHTALV